jgi:hypothetical protein
MTIITPKCDFFLDWRKSKEKNEKEREMIIKTKNVLDVF